MRRGERARVKQDASQPMVCLTGLTLCHIAGKHTGRGNVRWQKGNSFLVVAETEQAERKSKRADWTTPHVEAVVARLRLPHPLGAVLEHVVCSEKTQQRWRR